MRLWEIRGYSKRGNPFTLRIRAETYWAAMSAGIMRSKSKNIWACVLIDE